MFEWALVKLILQNIDFIKLNLKWYDLYLNIVIIKLSLKENSV